MYVGDYPLGSVVDVKFSTVDDTGAPTTLAGSPAVAAYVGNGTTELTAGITLSVDFDSVTGLHNVRVVATDANGYADQTQVSLVLTSGTVGGVSVVGYVVGSFSLGMLTSLTAAAVADAVAAHADIAPRLNDIEQTASDTTSLLARTPSPDAALRFDRAAKCIALGTVDDGATTTVIPTKSLDAAAVVANQFKGLIMKYSADTVTSALRNQGTDIISNTSDGVFTVTELTTAPSEDDVFVIQ